MSSLNFDSSLAFHPAVDTAGNEALGAWFRALAWSEMYRTARIIPASMARKLAPPRVWAALERAGFAAPNDHGWTLLDPLPKPSGACQPKAPVDNSNELTPRQRAGRAGGLAKAARSTPDPVANLASSVASPVATPVASDASPSNGVATPLARHQADLDPSPEISEKSQRSSPPIVPPLFADLANADQKTTKNSSKTSRRTARGQRALLDADPRIDEVLGHWAGQKYHGKKPLVDVPDRRERIARRLAEGFSVDDLKLAADGASFDDNLMGRREGSPGYRGVETIFRDAGMVERLRELALQHQPRVHHPAGERPERGRYPLIPPAAPRPEVPS